jgi:uncharacterized protein (DUF58 family)
VTATAAFGRSLRRTPVVSTLVSVYEERLTSRGRALLWATAAFALVGVDTRRTQVFRLFAVAAALLLVARAFTLLRRPRVHLDFGLPARATARSPLTLRAGVRSADRRRSGELRLRMPVLADGGDGLSFTPPELLLRPDPEGRATAEVRLVPSRRGRYVLAGASIALTDPLGLTASAGMRAPGGTLLVYPRFWSMDRFEIPLGRRYQPGGIPLSSSTGDAIEFVGTRDYREGDPLRHIHWRSWARRGQPVVKEYQEEYFCRIAIVLDTFLPRRPSPEDLAGFEAGISVVASVADFFSRSEYVVDILAAGPDLYEVSAGRSLAYLENILDVLACLEPCHDPPFRTIGPPLFEKLAQITTVVAVLQDWDAPREAFLRQVHALGTAVRVVIVRQGDTTLPWEGALSELGEIDRMGPEDVESALARSQGRA